MKKAKQTEVCILCYHLAKKKGDANMYMYGYVLIFLKIIERKSVLFVNGYL